MMKNNFLIFVYALCLFLLAGCSDSRIMIDSVEPLENHISSQDLDIRNCGTRTELRKTLASEFQIDENIIINGGTASLEDIESSLPADLRNQLEKEIKATYKEIYDEAKKELDETILVIPANEVRTYRINHEEKAFNAAIHFTTKGETRTWSYTYSLVVPEIGEIWQSGCTA